MSDSNNSDSSQSEGRLRANPAEMAVGALGGLLVLAALAFLVYQGVVVREQGPQLRTAVTRVEVAADEQYVVHYRVANEGGVTAEAVRVIGELQRDGRTVEQVSSTVPYVPAESSRDGALVFTTDPDTGSLDVRAAAYNRP